MARSRRRPRFHWLALKIGVPLVYGLLRLLGATVRKRREGLWREFDAVCRRGEHCIAAFWHDDSFYMLYVSRLAPPEADIGEIRAMVSPGRDGDLMARFLDLAGMRPVRGSTTHGGGRALLGLIADLGERDWPVLAVDGSKRCRRFTAQSGVLLLAARTGLPVLPIAARAPRRWVLGRGDRVEIPYPFSRFSLVFGKPIHVPRDADSTVIECLRRELEEQLRQLKGID